MKRSKINNLIKEAVDFFDEKKFKLPVWATWTPDEWKKQDISRIKEINDNVLGWDITDFGLGNYEKQGLLLFTVRNGNPAMDKKPYAEKIMIAKELQETPNHFHWKKMEDIINRGGGILTLQLYKADENEGLSDKPFNVSIDGVKKTVEAGGYVDLNPGESICLEQYVYHRFFPKQGHGPVMIGEVSQVNDDSGDNRFYEEVGRFPEIEEDEPILYPLASDYKKVLNI